MKQPQQKVEQIHLLGHYLLPMVVVPVVIHRVALELELEVLEVELQVVEEQELEQAVQVILVEQTIPHLLIVVGGMMEEMVMVLQGGQALDMVVPVVVVLELMVQIKEVVV